MVVLHTRMTKKVAFLLGSIFIVQPSSSSSSSSSSSMFVDKINEPQLSSQEKIKIMKDLPVEDHAKAAAGAGDEEEAKKKRKLATGKGPDELRWDAIKTSYRSLLADVHRLPWVGQLDENGKSAPLKEPPVVDAWPYPHPGDVRFSQHQWDVENLVTQQANATATPVHMTFENAMEFEFLPYKCRAKVIEFVTYSQRTFSADCRRYLRSKPLGIATANNVALSQDPQCQRDICDLQRFMLEVPFEGETFLEEQTVEEDAGEEKWCKEMCIWAGFVPFDHCGKDFHRQMYKKCDYAYRGCSEVPYHMKGTTWTVTGAVTPDADFKKKNQWADFDGIDKVNLQKMEWAEALEFNDTDPPTKQFLWDKNYLTWNADFGGIPLNATTDLGVPLEGFNDTETQATDPYYFYPRYKEEYLDPKDIYLPAIEFKCYDQMTIHEQDAVRGLGYTVLGWGVCGPDISPNLRDHCGWDRTNAAYPYPDLRYSCVGSRFMTRETLVRDITGAGIFPQWDDLPHNTKLAFGGFGYDINSFFAREYTEDLLKKWSELTSEERRHAHVLGFTPELKDGCDRQICIARRLYAEQWSHPLYVDDWNLIGDGVKSSYTNLQWTELAWIAGGPYPPYYEERFEYLPRAVQTSVQKLGHDQESWDKCAASPCLERFSYMYLRLRKWFETSDPAKAKRVEWVNLKPRVKKSLEALGYTEIVWDNDGDPSALNTPWDDLTAIQVNAALELGYQPDVWSGCATSGVTTTTVSSLDPMRRVRALMTITKSYTEVTSYVFKGDEETTTRKPEANAGFEPQQAPKIEKPEGEVLPAEKPYVPGVSPNVGPEAKFSQMTREAIARTLFCNNRDFKPGQPLEDLEGNPLCSDRTTYADQQDRIKIMRISRGSIKIEIEIAANVTDSILSSQLSAVQLLDILALKLDDQTSDLAHDKYFGQYAKAAQIHETPFSADDYEREQREIQFESVRGHYTAENVCRLTQDLQVGYDPCTSHARRSWSFLWTILLPMYLLALGYIMGGS